jgi:hypothetical protein
MTDFEKIELAFDILQNAEVVGEFEKCVWIKVEREDWDAIFDRGASSFTVHNHNGTLLGKFDDWMAAQKEANHYRLQTGNAAYVREVGA